MIGSDEVFNCVQSNTNVGYSRDLFGHGSPAGRVISYAGSFGNTTLEKIEAFGIRDDLDEDFARFAAISVRDRNSAQIITALTGQEPSSTWTRRSRTTSWPRRPVFRPSDSTTGKVPDRLRLLGSTQPRPRMISSGTTPEQRPKDPLLRWRSGVLRRVRRLQSLQLLAYFRDAEAVITDTFHGTIFSIINNRPFDDHPA